MWVFPYEGCIGPSCTCIGTPNLGEAQLRKENPHPLGLAQGKLMFGCCVALHSRLRDPGDGRDARWRGNTPLVAGAVGGKGKSLWSLRLPLAVHFCVFVKPEKDPFGKGCGRPAPAAYSAPAPHLGTSITKFLVRLPTFRIQNPESVISYRKGRIVTDNAHTECDHPIFLQERMSGHGALEYDATVEEIKGHIQSMLREVRHKPNPSTHDTISQ